MSFCVFREGCVRLVPCTYYCKERKTMINTISKSQPLAPVVMSLVQVMATDGLTWSERERISEAIAACVRHSERMEKERQILNQQQQPLGTGQQVAAGGFEPFVGNTSNTNYAGTHPTSNPPVARSRSCE